MRIALIALALTSCSLVTETSDLGSGRRATDSGVTPGETCNPADCVSDIHVVKLGDIAPCSSTGAADNLACRQKVAAACKVLNPCCYKGGYGPVDFPNVSEATVYCFSEKTYTAPFSELTAANAKCVSSAPASRECDQAAHVSSLKRGHGTAVVQALSADTATLIALDSATPTLEAATWADLTKLDPACTFATLESQACTIAAHRFCATLPMGDYLLGYGPVTWTSTNVTIACLF